MLSVLECWLKNKHLRLWTAEPNWNETKHRDKSLWQWYCAKKSFRSSSFISFLCWLKECVFQSKWTQPLIDWNLEILHLLSQSQSCSLHFPPLVSLLQCAPDLCTLTPRLQCTAQGRGIPTDTATKPGTKHGCTFAETPLLFEKDEFLKTPFHGKLLLRATQTNLIFWSLGTFFPDLSCAVKTE